MFDKLVSIGIIAKPFGIKGQLKINIFDNFFIETLKSKKIYIEKNGSYDFLLVKDDNYIANKRILTFENINNINEVEKFTKLNVFVNKEEVDIIEEVNYLDFEVIYKTKSIGKVKSTLYNGKYDLLEVIKKDNKIIWIPFIEEFLEDVDFNKKTIKVLNIEGL